MVQRRQRTGSNQRVLRKRNRLHKNARQSARVIRRRTRVVQRTRRQNIDPGTRTDLAQIKFTNKVYIPHGSGSITLSKANGEKVNNMDYKKLYINLILDARKNQAKLKVDGVYTESHHVFPKSLGGSDDKWNLINLTAKDHFMAHYYLAKIHGGYMWLPVKRMAKKPKHVKIDWDLEAEGLASLYEEAKIQHSNFLSSELKGKQVDNFIAQQEASINPTVFNWEHKSTGKKVNATLKEMSELTGIGSNKLSDVAAGKVKSRGGWKLQGTTILTQREIAQLPHIKAARRRGAEKQRGVPRPKTTGVNNPKARSVRRVEDGKIYMTIAEAVHDTGAASANINRAIRTGRTAGGFHWEYV